MDEYISSNKDDNTPRVSCLFLVIALIDDEKDDGIIPFRRSRKHKLLLIELRFYKGD